MGLLDKISGKAVEDKVGEYSEIYGEVLLGLHREVERHNDLWDIHEKHLQEKIAPLTGDIERLKQQVTQNHADVMQTFETVHLTIEQVKSEAASLATAKTDLLQVTADVSQQYVAMKAQLLAQNRQIKLLRLSCLFSYLFIVGLGLAIWLIP
jgi:TolA-binding protein